MHSISEEGWSQHVINSSGLHMAVTFCIPVCWIEGCSAVWLSLAKRRITRKRLMCLQVVLVSSFSCPCWMKPRHFFSLLKEKKMLFHAAITAVYEWSRLIFERKLKFIQTSRLFSFLCSQIDCFHIRKHTWSSCSFGVTGDKRELISRIFLTFLRITVFTDLLFKQSSF